MPQLRTLELFHVAMPLKKRIAHASHERTASDNFIVRATLSDGSVGHGEGVPRSYVTGESIDTCFAAIRGCDFVRTLRDVTTPESALTFASRAVALLQASAPDERRIGANAAACALELALLDAYGRCFDCSVTDFVRALPEISSWLTPAPAAVRYSGAITAEGARKERISAWKMRLYGFSHVKVKVGVPGQDDARRLAQFRRILGRRVDIRVDANEAWGPDELVERVNALRPFSPSVLEQPVSHADVGQLAALLPRLGVGVMLDESLCGPIDAERAIEQRLATHFNVRLSKCGGIGASAHLFGLAFQNGLKTQLGCHPGESGILSAAGRHVAANIRGISYVEGSYDRHVLAENVIAQDITFGYGGRARPLIGPGLGVTVDQAKLECVTQRREVIDYG